MCVIFFKDSKGLAEIWPLIKKMKTLNSKKNTTLRWESLFCNVNKKGRCFFTQKNSQKSPKTLKKKKISLFTKITDSFD